MKFWSSSSELLPIITSGKSVQMDLCFEFPKFFRRFLRRYFWGRKTHNRCKIYLLIYTCNCNGEILTLKTHTHAPPPPPPKKKCIKRKPTPDVSLMIKSATYIRIERDKIIHVHSMSIILFNAVWDIRGGGFQVCSPAVYLDRGWGGGWFLV